MPAGQVFVSKVRARIGRSAVLPSAVPACQTTDRGWRDGTDDTKDATTTDQPRLNLVVSWHSCIGNVPRAVAAVSVAAR